jgi:hypothetical protein
MFLGKVGALCDTPLYALTVGLAGTRVKVTYLTNTLAYCTKKDMAQN